MASIYNIAPYKASKTYNTNDIVSHGGYFYYSKTDASSGNTPSIDSVHWAGTIKIQSGLSQVENPYFFWAASYGGNVQHEPKVKTIELGDGYVQRISEGTHSNLLSLQLSFTNRSEAESTAILHFLSAKEGYKSFYYKAPAPYSVIKKFVCASWSSTFNFQDDYNIQAVFQEVA
tara:strand:- start:476 stop:997 length:522 start_codon:yes stop_codon:yes gene_type:complete